MNEAKKNNLTTNKLEHSNLDFSDKNKNKNTVI